VPVQTQSSSVPATPASGAKEASEVMSGGPGSSIKRKLSSREVQRRGYKKTRLLDDDSDDDGDDAGGGGGGNVELGCGAGEGDVAGDDDDVMIMYVCM